MDKCDKNYHVRLGFTLNFEAVSANELLYAHEPNDYFLMYFRKSLKKS